MNTRKKVLFCITKSVWGGAQKYVYELATSLPPEQFEITVAAGGSGPLFELLKKQGIRTIFIPCLERDVNPAKEIKAFLHLMRIFRQEKPDIIHLNSTKMGSMGALAAAIAKISAFDFRPRVVFTVHGWGFREDRNIAQRLAIFTISWISALFHTHIILINSGDYQDAQAFIPRKKLSLIPLGIPAIDFFDRKTARDFFSKNHQVPDNAFLIGVTAELTKNKGLIFLLQALREHVRSSNPIQIHAVIMGEGEERPYLENRIKEWGLAHDTSLVGFVPDAKKYLPAFDAFVLPSVKEGLPYAIMEAMAAGLPVIASHVGGIPDLVNHQTTGLMTPPKNPHALCEHIHTLVSSAKIRDHMGAHAKEKILKDYSLDTMITRTVNLYDELTQSHQ